MMRTRKVERKQTELAGQCCTSQGRLFDITVHDLSNGGCRFADDDPALFVGAPANIMINGTGPHRCFVRWREDGQVGVSFVRPMSEDEIAQVLSGKMPPRAPAQAMPDEKPASAPQPAAPTGMVRRFC